MARLERRRDRDQQIGQLVLERAQALARAVAGEQERERAADRGAHEDHERGARRDGGDQAEDESAADGDVDELGGLERQVGALEQALGRVPLLEVAERLLGRLQDPAEAGELVVPLLAARLRDPREMRLEAAVEPEALARGEEEPRGEQHQQRDDGADDERPLPVVQRPGHQLRRLRGRAARIEPVRERDRRGAGARAGDAGVEAEVVARP